MAPALFIVRPGSVLAIRQHASVAGGKCDRLTRAASEALTDARGLTAARFAYIVAQLATLETEVRAIRELLSHIPIR